jgi:uncharacterized membrane protein YfcA
VSEPFEPQPLASRALETILEPATALVLAWIAAVLLVVHSDPLLATLVVLGSLGAFVAGLTGVGGAIVMIPLLLYVPPWIGTGQLALHEIAAITMVQVFAAAASGLAGHLREGFVDRRVVVTLGSGMMVGSLVGAVTSRWIPAEALQGIFATMAVIGAVMLLTMRGRALNVPADAMPWSAATGFTLALGVGLMAGAVGAGGAFLLIPLMLSVLHIPPRIAVGSSLAIALAGAATGLAGKFISGQVPGWPALALVAGALPAAQLGAIASTRLKSGQLRIILALLIAAVAIKMWLEILR